LCGGVPGRRFATVVSVVRYYHRADMRSAGLLCGGRAAGAECLVIWMCCRSNRCLNVASN